MFTAIKAAAVIVCALALIVTFRTENVLKSVFRVESPDEKTVLRTKYITLAVTIILFIVIFLIFK